MSFQLFIPPDTPELDKLADQGDKTGLIFEFLEWLHDNHYVRITDENGRLLSSEDMVYSFFNLDRKEIDRQRMLLLKAVQKHNQPEMTCTNGEV